MKQIILLLLLNHSKSLLNLLNPETTQFFSFLKQLKLSFSSQTELNFREMLFKIAKKEIDTFNKNNTQFQEGLNKFSIMTEHEKRAYLGLFIERDGRRLNFASFFDLNELPQRLEELLGCQGGQQ